MSTSTFEPEAMLGRQAIKATQRSWYDARFLDFVVEPLEEPPRLLQVFTTVVHCHPPHRCQLGRNHENQRCEYLFTAGAYELSGVIKS